MTRGGYSLTNSPRDSCTPPRFENAWPDGPGAAGGGGGGVGDPPGLQDGRRLGALELQGLMAAFLRIRQMGPGVHLPSRVGAGTEALGPSAPHNLLHSTAVSPPQKNGIAAALTRLQEENLGFKSPKLKSSNPEPFGF